MKLEVITRLPAHAEHSTPLLFIHGMWHAAWCWSAHFLPYFAQNGYKSHALSLRGHAASQGRDHLRWTSLSAYVSDVVQVVQDLDPPPVLIGHSLGGLIIQKYLQSHPSPAVVLLGSAPPTGLIPATLRIAARHPLAFLKSLGTLSLIHVIRTPALYQEAFFSQNMPASEVNAYHAQVQDESFRAYLDAMILDLPHLKRLDTPMLVLGAADDRLISPREVEATARAYQCTPEFFPGMGHALMLDAGWQAVADRILRWLNVQGL